MDVDPSRGEALPRTAMALFRSVDDQVGEADSLRSIARARLFGGDVDAAHRYHQEALSLVRAIGDTQGQAWSLLSLGEWALHRGQLGAARIRLRDALALFGNNQASFGIFRTQTVLGDVSWLENKWVENSGLVRSRSRGPAELPFHHRRC